MSQQHSNRRVLAVILSGIFILAIVMGPGPGLYLVNPDPSDPGATVSLYNIPVIYIWAVFWAAVQAAVVIIAYLKLWDRGRQIHS